MWVGRLALARVAMTVPPALRTSAAAAFASPPTYTISHPWIVFRRSKDA